MKSFLPLLLASASLGSPVIFRNSADQTVYLQMGNYPCFGTGHQGTSLYVTLPADQQHLATGPTIQFESRCQILYPPNINCQQTNSAFFGGVNIRAVRGMLPDCGNTSENAAMQMVLYGPAQVRGSDEFEYTSCPSCRQTIERFIYPPYNWSQPYCTADCGTKPATVGLMFQTDGVIHLGWMRYVYGSTTSGVVAICPLAWSYCTDYNEPARVPCAADHNVDGVVDFMDYLDYVEDFAAGSPRAKFNMYGDVSFFDYLDFLQAYSQGC